MFFVKTDKVRVVKEFVKETNRRLLYSGMAKNPFSDSSIKIKATSNAYVLRVDMKSIYPQLSFLAWVFVGVMLASIVFNWNPWVTIITGILSVLFSLMGFVNSDTFKYAILKRGLEKAGYTGRVELLKIGNPDRLLWDK